MDHDDVTMSPHLKQLCCLALFLCSSEKKTRLQLYQLLHQFHTFFRENFQYIHFYGLPSSTRCIH